MSAKFYAKYAMVFCHGFNGFNGFFGFDFFNRKVRKVLRKVDNGFLPRI
jgi:hypothetical protein